MKIRHLPSREFLKTPWKNGGGLNTDIASRREGTGWNAFDWRFGRTTIGSAGPFSDFSGYARLQVAISGSGLVLETPDGEIDLRQAWRPVRYDGALPIVTRLENGPVEVVNLIADKLKFDIALEVPVPGRAMACARGIHVLYAPDLAVLARLDGHEIRIAAGDACEVTLAQRGTLHVEKGLALLGSIMDRASSAA